VSLPSAHAGFSIEHHASLVSSNDRAMECARSGFDRHWVVVDQQTGGRGRQGRVWVSPTGNLYASLALIDPCVLRDSPQLGFVAGLATHEALASLYDFGDRLKLKWPNDLLLDGAKLSGQLLEGSSQSGHLSMVIGIGINLAHHPDNTPYPATDLAAKGIEVGVSAMLCALCEAFDRLLQVWGRGQGFARIRDLWLAQAAYLDREIEVRNEGRVVSGRFKGLDAEGRLLLQKKASDANEIATIEAGDFYPLDVIAERSNKGF
jgi:BirA family biotin operon repressor/biotin-[acetyl-CoA-carboxylase] ligase